MQQVGTNPYWRDLQADEPFRLELRHGAENVRTVNTIGYPPDRGEEGLAAIILGYISSIFQLK